MDLLLYSGLTDTYVNDEARGECECATESDSSVHRARLGEIRIKYTTLISFPLGPRRCTMRSAARTSEGSLEFTVTL